MTAVLQWVKEKNPHLDIDPRWNIKAFSHIDEIDVVSPFDIPVLNTPHPFWDEFRYRDLFNAQMNRKKSKGQPQNWLTFPLPVLPPWSKAIRSKGWSPTP